MCSNIYPVYSIKDKYHGYLNKTRNVRKEIILARKLFYENGYRQTTIAEISRTMNISKGHITYYFKSKNDIGSEIYANYIIEIKNKIANKMYLKYKKYEISIATAVEFRITCRMYKMFPNSFHFYEDMVTALFTNVTKHGPILINLKKRYKLDWLDEEDNLHFINYAWNGGVASVIINYFNGRIICPMKNSKISE